MGADDDLKKSAGGGGKIVDARVTEALPSGLFRVKLEDESRVLAHVSDRRELDFLRLLPAMLSKYDSRRTTAAAAGLSEGEKNEGTRISQTAL